MHAPDLYSARRARTQNLIRNYIYSIYTYVWYGNCMNFPVLFTTSQCPRLFINLTILRRRHAFLRHTLPPATHRPSVVPPPSRSCTENNYYYDNLWASSPDVSVAAARRRCSAFWWRRSFYNNIFVYKFVYILYFVYIFIYICKFQRFIATLHFYTYT